MGKPKEKSCAHYYATRKSCPYCTISDLIKELKAARLELARTKSTRKLAQPRTRRKREKG